MSNAGISQRQYLHNRSIVRFKPVFPYIGVSLIEGYNILEACSTKTIYGLGVIANNSEIAMFGCQQIDDSTLDGIRILVFIDENVQELLGEGLSNLLMLGQEPQPQAEQVVEVKKLPLPLSGHV